MITKDTTIDDLADSITALGTMMGERLTVMDNQLTGTNNQLTGLEQRLKHDFKHEIKQAIEASEKRLTDKLHTEITGVKLEIAELRREQRVTNERLNNLEGEMQAMHNDIVAAKTGLPAPKF